MHVLASPRSIAKRRRFESKSRQSYTQREMTTNETRRGGQRLFNQQISVGSRTLNNKMFVQDLFFVVTRSLTQRFAEFKLMDFSTLIKTNCLSVGKGKKFKTSFVIIASNCDEMRAALASTAETRTQ